MLKISNDTGFFLAGKGNGIWIRRELQINRGQAKLMIITGAETRARTI